jgi:ATP-dependent protease ClpP protease subunit
MTAKLYIYGDIDAWGENSAAAFTQRFNEACKTSDSIDLHIHSCGGQVFEGSLIYNLLKNSKKPVDVYIDGVAASMATIVILPARKIYMSANAYMMTHAPMGSVYSGTAAEMVSAAKLLRAMEQNFTDAYMARTNKSKEDIAKWLQGDNWFSAKDALAENLIDGIVDAVAVEVDEPKREELKGIKPEALYNRYAAKFNLNNNKMNKSEVIARYGLTGVTAESSEVDIYAAIEAKINDERNEKIRLQGVIDAQAKQKITDVVNAAKDAKKITDEQVPSFVAIGEKSGIEALKTALDAIKTVPSITAALQSVGASTTTADRATWDWDKWQKDDARGLEQMRKDEPEKFEALYNAKYKR